MEDPILDDLQPCINRHRHDSKEGAGAKKLYTMTVNSPKINTTGEIWIYKVMIDRYFRHRPIYIYIYIYMCVVFVSHYS